MAGTDRQHLIDILQLVGVVRLAGGRRNPPGGPANEADKPNYEFPLQSCYASSQLLPHWVRMRMLGCDNAAVIQPNAPSTADNP